MPTVKVPRDGTLIISDGTGSPNTFTVNYEDGDFSFSDDKTERIVIRDRGTIVGLRKGDDSVATFSFSTYLTEFTDGSTALICDIIEKTGSAAAWISTGGTGYEQYLLDVQLKIEGTDHGDGSDETLTLTKCFLNWDFAEAKEGNKINVTGEVYGTRVRA
tara:strand:+ start:95 stop:574 length:480 start_codon:yes stop_codon:yes gene_type:complete